MGDSLMLAFIGVQTVVIVATGAFTWMSIQKFRDSRGIDFIINAESAIDPLYQSMVGAPPEQIRRIYQGAIDLSTLNDQDVTAFPYMRCIYLHVSRICFLVADSRIDLGLRPDARKEVLDLWLGYLSLYRNHPAMMVMHSHTMAARDVNDSFLSRAATIMKPDGDDGLEDNTNAQTRQAT